MAEQNGTTAVETSVVNPKQESQVIENFDKVSSSSTPIEELQNNLQKFKTEKIHNFTDSAAWADYKSNLFRALDSNKYPGFAAIEKVHDDPIWKANVEAYGDIIADRAQAISGAYKRANAWGGRLAGAYNEQRYGLRVAAARKDLSDAILEGDDLKIATARVRLEKEQKNQYERGMEYEKYGNTLMSISASVARNPETIPVEIAGAVLAPVTYGISEGLARLINAGIVGADTYRLEAGSSLLQMDEEFPGMTEEQKHAGARKAGLANAAIEAGLMGAGVGVAGFGARTIGRAAASKGVEAAASSIAGKEIAKETFKTNFIKALQKPTKELTKGQKIAKTAADIGLNSIGEGLQEVFQDTITNAMLLSVRNGTPMTQEFLDDWADFVADPFNPAHADKWETFINVALASPILGGGFAVTGAGIRNIGSFKQKNTEHNGLGTIGDKISGAVNNSLGLSQLFNWHKKADAKNGLGAANAVLKAQIDSGEISGKLYTTVEQVQQMQQDPEIAEALAQMGIAEAMENASENGGVVELDLLAYDKVVNESQNTTLFQKMRNYLSFSDTTMSAAEFNEFIRSNSALVAKQITDEVRNDANSAFSRMKETMLKAGKSEAEAEGNAAVFHVMMERLKTLNGKESDIENRLSVSVETDQGAVTMPNAAEVGFTQKTVDNANQPANIDAQGATDEKTETTRTKSENAINTIRRNQRQGYDGNVWVDASTGNKRTGKTESIRSVNLEQGLREALNADGISTPNFTVYTDAKAGAKEYLAAMRAAVLELGDKAASVDIKELSDYENMKALILSEDKKSGVAVTQDGDIVSLFSSSSEKGRTIPMLLLAVQNGGTKLDCFDTFLPRLYSRIGFKAVARNNWIEEYKPEGWNKEYFGRYNNGEPDVVFMVYDPENQAIYQQGDGVLIKGEDAYDKGMAAQDEELARIAERDGATADVNVGGQTYHMMVGSRTEETVNNMADKLGKRKELDEARAMEKEAMDKGEMPDYEAIWAKTGWYKEPDTSWAYEIADNEIELKDRKNIVDDKGLLPKSKEVKLEDFISYPELFKLLPTLKTVNVRFYNDPNRTYKHGRYARAEHAIYLNSAYFNEQALYHNRDSVDAMLDTLVHEIQHAVQWEMSMLNFNEFQGYKGVRNSRMTPQRKAKLKQLDAAMADIYELNREDKFLPDKAKSRQDYFAYRNQMYDYAKTHPEAKPAIDKFVDLYLETKDYNIDAEADHVQYLRLAYETQARNTSTRRMLTAEQRREVSPSSTLDIAGGVQVGTVGKSAEALAKNTRELRVVRFSGLPAVSTQTEAGRTTAKEGTYQINLTKDANVVTFSHEMFHVFSLELQREYNNGTMTDYWKKQAEKMFKIVDAKPQPDPADPTVTRYFLTEAQEERLANMFTTYIMKGQIENKEIRGIMARMIDMFKAAYRQLDGRGLTALALNNKAKDFFNSVFNSQDQIEDIQRMVGLLEIPKPENVDQELYDYYIANMTASRVEAANDLRAKLFKIEEYRNSAEYEKKLQAFKEEAKEQLLDTEKYQILSWQNIFQGEDKAEKMLLKAQVEFPESNYTIGDINNILEKTEPLESASQQIAEDKMEADIAQRFNLTVKDLGFREERNKAKVRALIAESVMDRNGTLADVEEEVRRAEAAADKQLANMSVYQIMDMDKWKNREAAAVERYTWAKRNDKDELVAAERYNQAVLNLIMIKSNGFKSEYKKLTALFDKLQDRQKKYRRKDEFGKEYGELEHRYNAVDWELLRSISEQFGNKINDMRRSPKTVQQQLQDWIQTQVTSRFTTVANLEQFVPFINRGTDGSVGAMKGKDFKKLWAVMHTIDSIAMREQELFLDGQYENMNKYAQQVVEFYQKMNIKTDEEKTSWYARHFGRYGSWQNPEPLLKAILPTEVFNKIFLPMFNNAIKAERYGQQWIRTWRGVKAKIDTSVNPFVLDDGTTISYTRNEKTRTLSYADVADLLLAMGSNHSYENYKLKFGLSDEQAEMIASQALNRNKDYAEFLNTTWKVYGEATELLNNSFQERKNELFVRKDHRAFEINGVKFEGGYVPEDKHYLNLIRELGTINQGMKNNKNEKLIIKHADGDVLSITDITETKLSQSAKWAFAAIPYNNIQKFMQMPAVRNTMGERAFSFVQDWLQAYDTPHTDVSGMWRPLSQATTIAALGARASTALLQLSGLSQGWAKLGTTYMGRGMLRFIRNGEWVKPFKMAQGKSDYMAARVENPFSSLLGNASQGATLREIFNSYNAKTGLGKAGVALLSAWQRAAMFGIQLVDGYVSNVTWNGAYLRALDKGMSEADARLEADSLVRITQSDAMQISRSAAQQEPYARAVTAFATWLMAMRSETMAKTTSNKYAEDMVIWIASYAIFGTFMEACLQELTGPVDKDKEDKEVLERIFNSWYNKITESVGTYVMPFAGIGATGAKAIMAGFVNTDDEKIYEVFAGGNVSALQYAWNAIDTVKTTIEYAMGDEEKGEKALIKATGLVSYNLKKRIKNALEE